MSANSNLRLQNLRRSLAAQENTIPALLVTDLDNIGYLTGFTGSTAQALVTQEEAIFITDSRYTAQAASECPDFTLVETPRGSGGYGEALQMVLSDRPSLRQVGFEAGDVTVSSWESLQKLSPEVTWISTESLIETLRQVKDAGEIALIRKAIQVAEESFLSVKNLLSVGMREMDFALELEFAMRRGGAEKVAFDSIVASGPLGARPHHHAGERRLANGDFVTIDWGATVQGYNSDLTRTFGIGLITDHRQREIYEIVLKAQQLAIAAILPGLTGKEIDAVARDYITSHGYGEAFGHSLGHSLGRAVHDGPGLSVRSEDLVLQPGMVLTVEPGIYLEDWGGIRIEEDILVTENGCEILTHLPNALEVL